MAKAAADGESAGMDRAELKRHLRLARAEPVNIAFALGGDGQAVLQMDRRKQPRALEKGLKESAPDSKNHRFGTALVDPDNPKLVRFVVNKAGGGLARKLVVALKGTGFNRVEIVLEDGTAVESHEEADEEDQDTPQAAAASKANEPEAAEQPQAARGNGMLENMIDPDRAAPEKPQQNAPPAGQPDAAALARTLTRLVKDMLAAVAKNPSQKAALTELATDAQASLKRGDLDQASAGIDILRQAIEAASNSRANGSAAPAAQDPAAQDPEPAEANGGDGPSHPAAPAIAKARHAWVATRKKVEGDIGNLHGAFDSALKGHDMAGELGKLFRSRVDSVLDSLDEALAHKLDEVNKAADAAQRAKHVKDAHALIQRYQAHIAGDKTIALLDSNPFTPLGIQKTMAATLSALSRAIR